MSDERPIYYVGTCRICRTGPLGLRQCGGCDEIVVMCDECDAVWTDGNFAAKPLLANEKDLPCPFCEASLFEPPSHWAEQSAIDQLAWLQTAVQAGELVVKSGQALP